MDVSLDFETRSLVDLGKAGATRYAQDPSTDIWCACFYVPDLDDILTWRPGMPHGVLGQLAADPTVIFRAWNAAFERRIWREIMVKRYGFPDIPLHRWRCTAAEAAALALPRKLESAAKVLGASHQKDDAGHRLMLRMAKPRRILPDGTPEWWDDHERVQRLIRYCAQDVRTEMAVKQKVRDLTDYELRVYQLDQLINDRGVMLDSAMAEAVRDLAAEAQTRANRELREVTNGRVAGVTKRADILTFLQSEGTETEKVDKEAVRALLARDDLTEAARRVLELRAEAGKSSVSKVDKMFSCVCFDGRMRDLLLYHGAGTGRWTGRLIQPQNLPARSKALGDEFDADQWREPVLAHDYDLIDACYPPLEVLAMQLRPCLRAAPGHRFVCADFAAIEARVLAWLADERWLLEAFRKGADVYRLMAADIYHKPVDLIGKPSAERDMGKRVILGCGFGMGWKKFILTCAKDDVLIEDAAAQQIIDTYRDKNSRIKAFWYELERCAVAAVKAPGEKFYAAGGKLIFTKRGDYLWIALPGRTRALAYYKPRIVEKTTPWGSKQDAVRFWGEDSTTRKWMQIDLYGGLIAENIVQAVARDLMVDAMFRVEAAGYPLVLTVHDELLCEVPDGFGDLA
ncbi:MAG TPA: DNA polymerase, partial [Ramlibacter sp.]|uniref:DNA polymerase n=1 Tax=Ramlibacter sp. TaxID=1917967 RepID=UPI002B5778EC